MPVLKKHCSWLSLLCRRKPKIEVTVFLFPVHSCWRSVSISQFQQQTSSRSQFPLEWPRRKLYHFQSRTCSGIHTKRHISHWCHQPLLIHLAELSPTFLWNLMPHDHNSRERQQKPATCYSLKENKKVENENRLWGHLKRVAIRHENCTRKLKLYLAEKK